MAWPWQENLGRFLVGLANEITNNVTGGLQGIGQNFSSQLSKFSTVISAQDVSQIVGVFEGVLWNLDIWSNQLKSTYFWQVGMMIKQKG